jgi:hypothetical protein
VFIQDKFGNAINVDQVMGFFVAADPANEGAFEVQANNSDNVMIAQFSVSPPMTEAEADALFLQIQSLVGTLNLETFVPGTPQS